MKAVRSYTFLLLVLAMVLSPGLALLGHLFPSKVLENLTVGTLSGAIQPAKTPRFDLSSFFSGALQSALEPWLAEKMGRPREIYLRLKNGFDFLLGRSDAGISIGRARVLNGKSYVDDWCLRGDIQQTQAAVAPLIADVVSIQRAMEARHKPFVFLISPSKPAVYPEYLPLWCTPADQPRPYDVLLSGLKSANVHIVDGHSIALQMKAKENWAQFGRDGAHWNDIGQFHAVRALLTELENQLAVKIGDLKLSDVRVDDEPRGAEGDAGLLANLPFTLRPHTAHASFEALNRQTMPVGLLVGTSFSWGPLQIMMGQRLFSQIRFYYYFSSIYGFSAGDLVGRAEDIAAQLDFINWISDADFVVLEANEAELGVGHIPRFAAGVAALPKPLR